MKSLLTVMFCSLALATGARALVPVGQPAPDFQLPDIHGQVHRLSDYKGKVVVLEWTNPECPIVRKHYESGNMPRLQKEATAAGVIWLSINSGHPGAEGDYGSAAVTAWLAKNGAVPTQYLQDHDGTVGHRYGARTTPHMFVISSEGILVYEGAIDSISSSDPADIPRATNYVKAALDSLSHGKPVEVSASRPYGCWVKY